MSRTSYFLITILTITSSAFGSDDKYVQAMQKNITTMYQAGTIQALQEAVNAFERIASVEKDKWEPLYYIAYGNIMMANFEKDPSSKDSYLDKANDAINKAKIISPAECELAALEGFSHMMRLSVDPQSRGMIYAPRATEAYQRALSIDPNNPRALTLLAQMQLGTARFFGSAATEACETNSKALQSFGTYKSDNPLAPVWGLRLAESLKTECK